MAKDEKQKPKRTITEDKSCFIKVRKKGSVKWLFITRQGTTNLRIHASRFQNAAQAQRVIDANAADNPEWEWMVTQ